MIIGLTGYKQAGKDSTADILVREFGFEKHAFADALRRMALDLDPWLSLYNANLESYELIGFGEFAPYSYLLNSLGYERAKRIPSVREFLQRLGTEGVRKNIGENAWVDALHNTIKDKLNRLIVVSDVRFPNEAAYIKQHGLLWRIVREGQVNTDTHDSERFIDSLEPDMTIVAANLSQLHSRVSGAWHQTLIRQEAYWS